MLAQTIRRRILLTGGSGALSTTAPGALGAGLAAGAAGLTGAGGGGEPETATSPEVSTISTLRRLKFELRLRQRLLNTLTQ